MALRAVVLPAPFGPMRPTMRPVSIEKLTWSRARVLRKFFVRPRASIIVVIVLSRARGGDLRRPGRSMGFGTLAEQLGGGQTQALDRRVDPRPLVIEKSGSLVFHERLTHPNTHEHSATSPLFDQLLVHQLLITLEDRQRIQPELGRNAAHGGQRIAFLERAFENHGDYPVPQLPVYRQAVVPQRIHEVSGALLSVSQSKCV